jgi:hypothetical protein
MKQVRRRLIYANVMASLAALLVLGGGTAGAVPGGELEELPPLPSSIALKCQSPVQLGQTSACTATVTGGVSPFFPRGQIRFARTELGSFGSEGVCTLAHLTGNKSRCQVTYTPAAPGSHGVTASYAGEGGTASRPGLEPSEGSTEIQIVVPPRAQTVTFVECGDVRLPAEAITCVAGVVDVGANLSTPGGDVQFSKVGNGFLAPAHCELQARDSKLATCSVNFVPLGPGSVQIGASYSGDSRHEPSNGTAAFELTVPSPGTAVPTLTMDGASATSSSLRTGSQRAMSKAKRHRKTAKLKASRSH